MDWIGENTENIDMATSRMPILKEHSKCLAYSLQSKQIINIQDEKPINLTWPYILALQENTQNDIPYPKNATYN
jgi:hypothetical protein